MQGRGLGLETVSRTNNVSSRSRTSTSRASSRSRPKRSRAHPCSVLVCDASGKSCLQCTMTTMPVLSSLQMSLYVASLAHSCPRRRTNANRGPWQLFARGPYLRETKTYLSIYSRMQCVGTSNLHDYQHNTTMSVQFSSSLSQRPIFIFLLQMLCQIT